MNANLKKTVFAAVVLAVQCAAMGWLIWRYESIVRYGTEVRFPCQAYDPCDPLRGRYLRTTVSETGPETAEGQDVSYVKLEPSTNGLWRVAAAAAAPQPDGGLWVKPPKSRVERAVNWGDRREKEEYSDFEKRRSASPFVVCVSMPDMLFLNEKLAPAAEKVLREAVSAKGKGAVAVYRIKNGEIVMTDIEIDGKSVTALAREKLN